MSPIEFVSGVSTFYFMAYVHAVFIGVADYVYFVLMGLSLVTVVYTIKITE